MPVDNACDLACVDHQSPHEVLVSLYAVGDERGVDGESTEATGVLEVGVEGTGNYGAVDGRRGEVGLCIAEVLLEDFGGAGVEEATVVWLTTKMGQSDVS